jgi:hypothetical protein
VAQPSPILAGFPDIALRYKNEPKIFFQSVISKSMSFLIRRGENAREIFGAKLNAL